METRTHTALHVLKGASRKVLGDDAKWTAGVRVAEATGRLTLQFNRKPTEEEIKIIENQANAIIQKNLTVQIHQMTQEEARERYGEEHLDLFPIPTEIKTITILEIQDWNINACNRPHTNTTGEIGQITIRKIRFRQAKQRLEISFAIM